MRWRYCDDIADAARLEESVQRYIDVAYRVAWWWVPRIRYYISFRRPRGAAVLARRGAALELESRI